MSHFVHRSREQEIMDDFHHGGEVIHQTLRELEIINRWLGGNAVTLAGVRKLLNGPPNGTLTIADLGCGGGEMLKLIAGMGRKANIPMRLTGIDANPHIIEFARQHSSTYPEIDYSTVNLFSEEFSSRKFDIYVATLVVHHFSDEELVGLLRILIRQASRGVVINDIHRHWFAFHSIRWLTRLFSNSSMVKFDAPLSVLRAFTRKELEDLLSKAGISTYHLVWKWAFRWQLIITPV